MFPDASSRASTADALIKRTRRSLAALFVATQPLMQHLQTSLSASEEERKEFFVSIFLFQILGLISKIENKNFLVFYLLSLVISDWNAFKNLPCNVRLTELFHSVLSGFFTYYF